jgi:hypothetical protein
MQTARDQRRGAAAEPEFATVADGVRAQVIRRTVLPPHLTSSAHEGRNASCPCRPLLEQLVTVDQWSVSPKGTRAACTDPAEHHDLKPLRVAVWPLAPVALRVMARGGRVELTLAMCAWCGAVEVRDVSYHAPAGIAVGSLQPRRRSDVLGWYAGSRPAGRIYT